MMFGRGVDSPYSLNACVYVGENSPQDSDRDGKTWRVGGGWRDSNRSGEEVSFCWIRSLKKFDGRIEGQEGV